VGGEHQVCVLHDGIDKELAGLNKDIGKVSERLGRVEEHTKEIPKILAAVESLKNQKAHSSGFIAGVAFVVSGVVSLVGIAVSVWFSRGH
jgi:hypothetical protein